MSAIWFLLMLPAAFAETTPAVEDVHRRFEQMACSFKLDSFVTLAPTASAAAVAASITDGIAPDLDPGDVGSAFLHSYARAIVGRPIKNWPYYDGGIPHKNALERLNKLVYLLAPALASRADAAAVAKTVGEIYAGLGLHAGLQRGQIDDMALSALRDFGSPASAPAIRRAVESLSFDLTGESPPAHVARRLDEVGTRQFLASEVTLIRGLLSHPGGPRAPHLLISNATNLTVEALRARLENDFRLLRLTDPKSHSKESPEVRAVVDLRLDGAEALRLRQAVDVLGEQLETDAVTIGQDPRVARGLNAVNDVSSGLFHKFDLPTNELVMSDAIASARLRSLLLDRRAMPRMQPRLVEEKSGRFGRPRTQIRYELPPDERALRITALKWYVAFVRPELMLNPFEQPGPIIEEAAHWRQTLDERQVAQAAYEIRRGGFDPGAYRAWSEAAEAWARLPAPSAEPPLPPGALRRATKAAAPHLMALGLSVLTAR